MTRNVPDEDALFQRRREEVRQQAVFDALRKHLPPYLEHLQQDPKQAYAELIFAAESFFSEAIKFKPADWQREYNLFSAAVCYEQAYLKADELFRQNQATHHQIHEALRGLAGTFAVWRQFPTALSVYRKSLRALPAREFPAIEADTYSRMAALHIMAWQESEVSDEVKFMLLHAAAMFFLQASRGYLRGQEILDQDPRTFTDENREVLRHEVELAGASAMFNLATTYAQMDHKRPALRWAERALQAYQNLAAYYDVAEVVKTIQAFLANLR